MVTVLGGRRRIHSCVCVIAHADERVFLDRQARDTHSMLLPVRTRRCLRHDHRQGCACQGGVVPGCHPGGFIFPTVSRLHHIVYAFTWMQLPVYAPAGRPRPCDPGPSHHAPHASPQSRCELLALWHTRRTPLLASYSCTPYSGGAMEDGEWMRLLRWWRCGVPPVGARRAVVL